MDFWPRTIHTVLHLIRKGFTGEVASKMTFKEFRYKNMGGKRLKSK